MAINFKKINYKCLIIPLSLIVFGGINNSIQAMDGNYGQKNIVDVNNNNNIINTNKLKEEIRFYDFKGLLESLADYNCCSEDYKTKIYDRFANIINLLQQFVKDAANSTTFYEICKRNIKEQIDMENSMISYETCLHYLLDFKCFSTVFNNFTHCLFAHIGFIKILKDYSKNFDKDEYKKILRIIFNNYLDNIIESNDYFKSTLDNNNFFYSYDIFKYIYKRHFPYNKKHDFMVTICMPTVIKELAKIEYNNYINTSLSTISDKINAISNGIMNVSDKIMNDSIIPYVKKSILELLDSYCKYKISEEKKTIEETIMLKKSLVYKYEKDIQKLKENFDESFIKKDILFCDRCRYKCKKDIQKLIEELNKFPKDSELEKIIEQAILGKEEVKQLTKDLPKSVKILRKEIGQVTKALDDRALINKIKEKLDIDYIVYDITYNNLLKILNNYKHKLKKDEYKQILKIMLNNCLDCIFDSLEPAFWDYNINNIFFNYQDYYYIHYINVRHFYLFYRVIDEFARFEYSNYPHMSMPIKTISEKIMNDLIMPHIKERIFKMLDSYCKNYISEKKEMIKKNIIYNNNSKNEYKQNLEQLEEKIKDGKGNENLKKMSLSCNKICLDKCEKSIKELNKELEELPKDSELEKMIEKTILGKEKEVKDLVKYWPESIKDLVQLTDQVAKSLYDNKVKNNIMEILSIDFRVHEATKNLRKEEIMNTFSKKAKMQIKSKYLVKTINDLTKDNRVIKLLTRYELPVVKQKVNENNESKEVNINNESEKK